MSQTGYGCNIITTIFITNFHFLFSGAPASTFGQPPPPSYGATANPSQSSQGGFNFGAAAASPPSFAFGSAPAAPSSGAAPAAGGFAFGGSQQATPTFGAMPQTPQQQQQSNMFNIGAGPAQPPKGRTIARARRTRR